MIPTSISQVIALLQGTWANAGSAHATVQPDREQWATPDLITALPDQFHAALISKGMTAAEAMNHSEPFRKSLGVLRANLIDAVSALERVQRSTTMSTELLQDAATAARRQPDRNAFTI